MPCVHFVYQIKKAQLTSYIHFIFYANTKYGIQGKVSCHMYENPGVFSAKYAGTGPVFMLCAYK